MSIFKTTIEKLKKAKQKRLQRKNVGTDEEYSKIITEEYLNNNNKILEAIKQSNKKHSTMMKMLANTQDFIELDANALNPDKRLYELENRNSGVDEFPMLWNENKYIKAFNELTQDEVTQLSNMIEDKE